MNVARVYATFAQDLRHGTSPKGGDVADLVFAMRCTLHDRRQVSGRVLDRYLHAEEGMTLPLS